jgi:hypothetical protein
VAAGAKAVAAVDRSPAVGGKDRATGRAETRASRRVEGAATTHPVVAEEVPASSTMRPRQAEVRGDAVVVEGLRPRAGRPRLGR